MGLFDQRMFPRQKRGLAPANSSISPSQPHREFIPPAPAQSENWSSAPLVPAGAGLGMTIRQQAADEHYRTLAPQVQETLSRPSTYFTPGRLAERRASAGMQPLYSTYGFDPSLSYGSGRGLLSQNMGDFNTAVEQQLGHMRQMERSSPLWQLGGRTYRTPNLPDREPDPPPVPLRLNRGVEMTPENSVVPNPGSSAIGWEHPQSQGAHGVSSVTPIFDSATRDSINQRTRQRLLDGIALRGGALPDGFGGDEGPTVSQLRGVLSNLNRNPSLAGRGGVLSASRSRPTGNTADRSMIAAVSDEIATEVGPTKAGIRGASEANVATGRALFDRLRRGDITLEQAKEIAQKSDENSPTGASSTASEIDRLMEEDRKKKERQRKYQADINESRGSTRDYDHMLYPSGAF